MKKRLVSILSTVVAATVLLTACGTKKTTDDSSAKADATQILNLIGYDYSSLDPNIGTDSESATTAKNVYEGLYREVEENGVQKSVPAVAESMDKNADGTVYTFHLRKDAKWSDGKPVTADQFVYSWKRLLDPKVASPYSDFIDMVKGAKEYRTGADKTGDGVGVKAVDEYTFEVTLSEPSGYFEKVLSFSNLAPVRKDLVEAQGDQFGTDYKTMVYNGPFVVSEYQKGSKIVYTKNDQYWDKDNVKLTQANGIIYQEPSVGTKMFENKEIDVVGASGDDLVKLNADAKSGKIDVINGYSPSVFYTQFNVKNEILKNAKVRRAMSLTINRKEFLDVVYKRFVPAEGLVAKAVSINDKEYRDQVDEPLKALADSTKDPKALYEEGLKEINVDPSKASVKILFGPKTARSQLIGEYLQKNWKDKLGLDVQLNFSVDGPSYFKDRNAGKYDLVIGGWSSDYDDVSSFFGIYTTGSGNNTGNYSNAKYDELVKQADREMDQAKRTDLYKAAEKIAVVEDPALAPLYYQDVNSFTQKYLKGYYVPHFNGYYDLKPVYISGK
ncbi:peptide ABC transporter substrate-binding protein [Clostridium sp. UBA1652]|uniref:peptide ABC transporter substrate-binding protein n=1 Tax=Clostridium sp. UBA1652 TaxID=1946348 RepID=UPI00257D4026|nr:peptide ABC transporter substrate-binding protein [Clostridium sp. UBA1652]